MQSWGRWGTDDERGSLNLLGAEQIRRGIAEVRDGTVVALAAPIRGGRGFGVVGRPAPAHYMIRDGGDYAAGIPERGGFGFADDVITLPTHGVTHVDALAHVWQDGQMYNGHPAQRVTSRGATRLGIDKMSPVVTRGVFVDSAPGGYRSPSNPIHVAELKSLVADSGVELAPGDALLIRTGWLEAANTGIVDGKQWPGLDHDCAEWLAECDVALLGADNVGVEAFPSSDPDCQVPLHVKLLRGHGVYFSELMDLAQLAAAKRATFLFVLAPLPLVGGVGSPVAPVAVL
ncbi:cyclase family protein [Mycobacterium sp.]|uniref:cyclase family protein n=1 Tax=Mycobacterium sp. TaxID=1785 RepID=UPI003D11A7F7